MLPNIKPMINRAMVSLTLEETPITRNSTKQLPKLEAMAKEMLFIIDSDTKLYKMEAPIIRMATPKLAPELIPRTKGPANGFLNRVCIKRPLSAKPPPTSIAVMAFGKR